MNNNNENEKQINLNKIMSLKAEEKNNNTKEKSFNYKCILHCPLKINDCVNSIDIFNNNIAYGTIMGDAYFCRIDEEKDFNIKNEKINLKTNLSKNINKRFFNNDLNKTDSSISENKNINCNNDNKKEIILNINKKNKLKIKDEKNNKETTEYKSPSVKRKENDHQSTDNYSCIDISKIKQKNKIYAPKIQKLIEYAKENICCISLYNDILNFSIGDFEIIHCEKISSFYGEDISLTHNYRRIAVYESNKNHRSFCENSSCLMSAYNFLIIYSFYSDFNWPLNISLIKYHNRNLYTNELIAGYIEMSNYNVPFDFDGDDFLYIEYYDESVRCINIYKTLSNKIKFKYLIDKQFGHISHMKLLPDNCIFLCRNLYECEIYKYKDNKDDDDSSDNYINMNIKENNDKDDFFLINKWIHNQQKEIISSNVYILGSKINHRYYTENNKTKIEIYKNNSKIKKENKKNINYNYDYNTAIHNIVNEIDNNSSVDSYLSRNKMLDYEKNYNYNKKNNIINSKRNEEIKEDKVEQLDIKLYKKDSLKVNFNDSEKDINEFKEKYYIITLDIDGNFNIYFNTDNNKGIKSTLFNLYQIDNISQKYKNLKFFSVGFPYYITMNEFYYVITTDNGVFIMEKVEEFNNI